jgi:hypothetical protein
MSMAALRSIDTRERLLGSWRLLSWDIRSPTGEKNYPLGPDAVGQLSYGADGRMSAQLMRRNQPPFADDDWRKAATEEKSAAWSGYFGYFGTYSIDEEEHAVTHHVKGSWFPNLVDSDEVRYFRFERNKLILDADTAWGRVQIVWEKIITTGPAGAAPLC